jgi:hypothetical protein
MKCRNASRDHLGDILDSDGGGCPCGQIDEPMDDRTAVATVGIEHQTIIDEDLGDARERPAAPVETLTWNPGTRRGLSRGYPIGAKIIVRRFDR